MAIQDDWTIDVVDLKITYSGGFTDDRPTNIYTVNQLYSWLQDTFDEPGYMQYAVPMTAQTPTQYTIVNKWFFDDESMKALYGGSIQTSGWAKSGSEGITALRWASATSAPESGDIGKAIAGVTSLATGVILAVDTVRNVVWVRNTSAAQFQNSEVVDDDATGIDPDFTLETTNGFQTGESVWANLFSVGSLQSETEIYVGQEDDYLGGRSYHTANPEQRRIEKVDEWWDSDVDFATGSPNLLGGAGHFDILVKVDDAGAQVDSRRLAVFARQYSKVYSHFELVGGVGNFVVPFASTGADLNAQDGPYTANFDGRTGNDLEVGDVLENNSGPGSNDILGRLRCVVTQVTGGASATGSFEYFLIGENEPLTTTDRTLVQLADNDDLGVRGDTTDLDVNGTPTQVTNGPAQAGGITITFSQTAVDVDEDSTNEQYACTIDCNNLPLSRVYQHTQFLTSRGNQDGTTADTQDTLLQTAVPATDEAAEFYRAVGDLVVTATGKTGTGVAEGDYVVGQTSGATAVVISTENTASGLTVLHQVKGTFQAEDISPDGGTNYLTIAAPVTADSIVDVTGSPFGAFAGGKWFVARGVVLTNVLAADANNWETIDLTGARRAPPTSRNITFAGLASNVAASIFEVGTAGGTDVVKTQNGVASGGAVGSASFVLDSTIALDVPATGWVRVVDDSATDGLEQRLAYSSISGTTVNFDQGAWSTGATTGSESATVLTDTGAFTSFGGAGQIRRGMLIRNDTLSEWAIILRKIDNDSIETTPLSGGGNWHSGGTADTWTANAPVVAFDAADPCYFGFIDDVATSGTIAKAIKFVHTTECIARARFSDPDIGGQRKLPFAQTNVQITDADLTVTAILNDDTIAS